jgi:hypothetical protein
MLQGQVDKFTDGDGHGVVDAAAGGWGPKTAILVEDQALLPLAVVDVDLAG